MLVEEAIAGDTPRLGCPRDDQDILSLAGVAKPASMTVYDDSLGSPCIVGTLSSSDMDGRLLPIMTAVIPSWSYRPCWRRWPVSCRWPRWPRWEDVPI